MEQEVGYLGCLILLGTVALRSLSSQLPTVICAQLNNCLKTVHSETLFHRHYGQDSPSLDLSTIHQLPLSQKVLKLPFFLLKPKHHCGKQYHISSNTLGGKPPKIIISNSIKSSVGTLVETEAVWQMYGFPVASRTTSEFEAAVHSVPLAKLCVWLVTNACRRGGTA